MERQRLAVLANAGGIWSVPYRRLPKKFDRSFKQKGCIRNRFYRWNRKTPKIGGQTRSKTARSIKKKDSRPISRCWVVCQVRSMFVRLHNDRWLFYTRLQRRSKTHTVNKNDLKVPKHTSQMFLSIKERYRPKGVLFSTAN
jgi:hypothetical protein